MRKFWRWITNAEDTEREIEIIKWHRAYERAEHEARMAAHQKRVAAREIYMID